MKKLLLYFILSILLISKIYATDIPNKFIKIDTNVYNIKKLFNIEKTASFHEDWIAIKSNKGGLGPHGGNFYLDLSHKKIILTEYNGIKNNNLFSSFFEKKNNNILYQSKFDMPININDSLPDIICEPLAYIENKLWFTIMAFDKKNYYADYYPYPECIVGIDIKNNTLIHLTKVNFQTKNMPYVHRIIKLNNSILFLTFENYKNDFKNKKTIFKNYKVYLYNEKTKKLNLINFIEKYTGG